MAQPFDTEQLELRGEPRPVADGVWFARGANHASFSASQTGTLAYVNSSFHDRQLVWYDRTGRRESTIGPAYRDANSSPQLSPDDRRIALARGELGLGDIWLLDTTAETLSRVTFDAAPHGVPVWSGDGRTLMFRERLGLVECWAADSRLWTFG